MNEEINKLVDILDNFNGMFGCLLSKPESNLLVSYIKQLEHNWNELKDYIKDRRICTIYDDFCRQILDKMQELEGVSNE